MVQYLIIWRSGRTVSYGVIFTTDSDTEVVMYALAIWGEKALEKFDGMFSIVFYNKSRKYYYNCKGIN